MSFASTFTPSTRFKRTILLFLGAAGVFASLSIWGRVPASELADADRQAALNGPAVTGSSCPVEGAPSKDARGQFVMCWKEVWTKP